jgi:DNA-directed RNA polymerase beta subunit
MRGLPTKITDAYRNRLSLLFYRTFGALDHHVRSMGALTTRGMAGVLSELGCNAEKDTLFYVIGNVRTRRAAIKAVDGTEISPTGYNCAVQQATFDMEVLGSIAIQTRDEAGGLRPPVRVDNLLLFAMPVPDYYNDFKFTVRGQQRIPVMKDGRRNNEAYVFPSGLLEVRSLDHRSRSTATLVMGIKHGRIVVILHVMGSRQETLINASLMMAVYGTNDTAQQVADIAQGDPALEAACRDRWDMALPDNAITELTRIMQDPHRVERMTTSEVLPHVTTDRILGPFSSCPSDTCYRSYNAEKYEYITTCVRQLLNVEVLHRQPYDNKDNVQHHTLETVGQMLRWNIRNVLASCFRHIRLRLRADDKRHGPSVVNPFYVFVINSALARAGFNARFNIAIGAMGSRKQGSKNIGRTIATQNTPWGDLSDQRMMRRSGLGGDASSASVLAPRQRQLEEYAIYGPIDTPDGPQVGLTKHIAAFTQVRTSASTHILVRLLRALLARNVPGGVERVMLNGKLVGRVYCVRAARTCFRGAQPVWLPPCVTMVLDGNVLNVHSDAGGMYRPLIASANTEPFINLPLMPMTEWSCNLLDRRVVLRAGAGDVQEPIAVSLTDGDPDVVYRLAELNTCALGSLMDLVGTAFSHHCANSRVLYQDLMSKQALGGSLREFVPFGDVTYKSLGAPGATQYLCYPEKNLAAPFTAELDSMQSNNQFSAQFAIYSDADNQEDSFVFSRGFVERGGGRAAIVSKETVNNEGRTKSGTFTRPETRRKYTGKYTMDADGMPAAGERVEKGDAFIGHVRHVKKGADIDSSIRAGISGHIVDTILTVTPEGTPRVQSRIETTLPMRVGDKASYKNGQKGVVGDVRDQENMPFSNDWNAPCVDVMCNATMHPSRTAPCAYAVMLAYLIAVHTGKPVECNPYQTMLPTLIETANRLGIARRHKMIDGRTGELIERQILCGPMPMNRLRHHGHLKTFSCGPTHKVSLRSHRAPGGRRNEGSLRFGEDEANASDANACDAFTADRLCGSADSQIIPICARCGNTSTLLRGSRAVCTVCPDGGEPKMVETTWSNIKQLATLRMMGVNMTFQIEKK